MATTIQHPPKPVLQAFILCEHFYQDIGTGKPIICGVYNQISLPFARAKAKGRLVKTRPTHVFASMTDFCGTTDVFLRFINLKNNVVISQCEMKMVSDDPLELQNIALEVPSLPVPYPGVYAFELHACNELVGLIRLSIQEIDHPETENFDGGPSHDINDSSS